jgi:hypothetical protein
MRVSSTAPYVVRVVRHGSDRDEAARAQGRLRRLLRDRVHSRGPESPTGTPFRQAPQLDDVVTSSTLPIEHPAPLEPGGVTVAASAECPDPGVTRSIEAPAGPMRIDGDGVRNDASRLVQRAASSGTARNDLDARDMAPWPSNVAAEPRRSVPVFGAFNWEFAASRGAPVMFCGPTADHGGNGERTSWIAAIAFTFSRTLSASVVTAPRA